MRSYTEPKLALVRSVPGLVLGLGGPAVQHLGASLEHKQRARGAADFGVGGVDEGKEGAAGGTAGGGRGAGGSEVGSGVDRLTLDKPPHRGAGLLKSMLSCVRPKAKK